MKKGKTDGRDPLVRTSFGGILLVLGIAGFFGLVAYWGNQRIHEVHRELFNADAPISYDFDFDSMSVVAKAKITSVPRADMTRWKELPFMSEPQTYRITHRINISNHTGTIELKVGDNHQSAEFLNTDIVGNFTVGTGEVSLALKPFEYAAPDFKLIFSDLNGTFSLSGNIKMKISNLEVKMVNYLYRLVDVSVEVPSDKKAINILASKITFDDVNLGHSKVVFMGTDPFEIKLQSTFDNQPLELHWNILKTTVKDQDVHVGSGKFTFPVGLLNAYIDPKVSRQLISEEKQVESAGNEKARFLFSAAKEVRRAEARALTLRAISSFKNIKREGDFYHIRIDKQDAFTAIEERAEKAAERKGYIDSWKALPKDRMFEEAFYGVIFGDDNRALAVKELLEQLKDSDGVSSSYQALKLRSELRDALITVDDYDSYKLTKVAEKVPFLVPMLGDHKFATLLRLEVAKAKGDKALAFQLYEEFRIKETDPQIRAMFEFMKYVHIDNPKALESLEKANEINPKSLYVQNLLRHRIHVHHHMGNKEKMEEDLKLLLTSQKPSTEDLLAYSNLLEEKKEFDRALEIIEKCIELSPVHKGCQEQKESVMTLIAYEKQKTNTDEAISYLENLVLDRPASVPANSGLGFLYKMKGDQQKSINHYSIACALGGSFACIEAGDYLARSADSSRALLLYDISCDLKSGNGCLKAGLVAEKSGQIERSGEFFDRSCNQYHDNVGCYHLARNLRNKSAPNRTIAPYLSKACKLFNSACKLATVYQTTNKQPDIPSEPK